MLAVKKLTNPVTVSPFPLAAHHPRKTTLAEENYSFPIRENNDNLRVFTLENEYACHMKRETPAGSRTHLVALKGGKDPAEL